MYAAAIAKLRAEGSVTAAELPKLLTVDSAIGTECRHVLIDLTNQLV